MSKPRQFWVSTKGSVWIDWDEPSLSKDFYIAGGKTYCVIEFSAYQSAIEELKAAKRAVEKIQMNLSGSGHYGFPINIRELDGTISQHRPKTTEGIAYDESVSLLQRIDKFLKEIE